MISVFQLNFHNLILKKKLEFETTSYVFPQIENCLSTYEPHACVVVYSVVAKSSFIRAGELLSYLARELFTVERTVVLVGNKADLARARQVSTNGE